MNGTLNARLLITTPLNFNFVRGNEFRPAYGDIGKIRSLFGKNVPWFVTSATLPLQQRDAVLESLKMPLDTLTIDEELGRDNLYYNVQPLGVGIKYLDGTTPIDHLIDLCRDNPDNIPKTLVYFDSIRTLQNVAKHLRSLFPDDFTRTTKEMLVQVYFSSRPKSGKRKTFEAFRKGECRIVLATEAFGMGMDVTNIVRIYIWGVPRSLASMIQRFGRGARDQTLVAICTLLLPTFACNIAIREGSVGAPTILSAGELRAWKKPELGLYNKLSTKNPAVMKFLESGCYRRAIAAYLNDSRSPGELLGGCCKRCSEREGTKVPQSIGPSENRIVPQSKPTQKQYYTTKYLAGLVRDRLIKWRLNLFRALSTLPNDADSIPGLLSLEAIMPLKTLQKLSSKAAYVVKGGMPIPDVIAWGTMDLYVECCFPTQGVEPLKDLLVGTFEAGKKLQKLRGRHLASSKNSGMSLKERQKEVDSIMATEEAAAFGDIDSVGLEQLHGDAAVDDITYYEVDWEKDDEEALGLRHMT
jgi:Helicase conserved C-terminal domain